MEVVSMTVPTGTSGPGGLPSNPFQRRDVREWSRIDRMTGVLEQARLEKDHWTACTGNSSHQYGKLVDDRAATSNDIRARQRRQLEVYRATETTTNATTATLQVVRTCTSSSWSTRQRSTATSSTNAGDFDNLQLALNPLDLSSQKTKVSVGRSGSIGGRRPPTRVRSINLSNKNDTQNTNEIKTTRLCHQQNNTNKLLQQIEQTQTNKKIIENNKTELTNLKKTTGVKENLKSINKTDIFDRINKLDDHNIPQQETKLDIADRKSADGINVFETFDTFEVPKTENEFEKITKENGIDSTTSSPIEFDNLLTETDKKNTDRRLNTALRNNSIDLDALDQILKNISTDTIKSITTEKPDLLPQQKVKPKRHSFITVESLKEVRGRLRRTSSPTEDSLKLEDLDDGIASEDNMIKTDSFSAIPQNSRVKSYVYGMENMVGPRKTIVGTGSLESRTSSRASNLINRSEDWYNRRKSYGFEQVHSQTNSMSLQSKNKIESSTDSGICRSTELFQPHTKQTFSKFRDSSTRKPPTSTVVNLEKTESQENELFNIWNKMSLGNNKNEQVTITIPIVSEDKLEASRKLYHRQFSENSSISIEQLSSENDFKRHSIAVDESKYVGKPKELTSQRRKSLVFDDPTESYEENNGRKKKVEFCKTEVHFAAESGRVNIVETDEKPPPTNNFRRRRRNSGLQPSQDVEELKNGLPLTHFGDTSYEKQLFSLPDHDNIQLSEANNDSFQETMVTVSANSATTELFQKELPETEYPKGILKNKIAKPKPYLLGDEAPISNEIEEKDDSAKIWGVKLRHVQRESPPFWKSTVTVQNNVYNRTNEMENLDTYKNTGGNTPKNLVEEDDQVDLKRNQTYSSKGTSLSFSDNFSKLEDRLPLNDNEYGKIRNFTARNSSFNLSETKMEERRTAFSSFADITPKTLEEDRVELRRATNSPYTGRSSFRYQGDKLDDFFRPSSLGNFQVSSTKFQEEASQRPSNLFENKNDSSPTLSTNSRRLSSSAFKMEDKVSNPRSSDSFRLPLEEKVDFRKISILSSSSEEAFKTPAEIKKSAWSVADRVKQVENFKLASSSESKGYSTKVNFGSGQTTVVESDRDEILWPEDDNIEIIENSSIQDLLDKNKPQGFYKPNISVRTTEFSKYLGDTSRSDKRQIIPAKNLDLNDSLSSPMLVGNSFQTTRPSENKYELQKTRQEIIDNNKNNKTNKNSVNKIVVSSYVRNVEDRSVKTSLQDRKTSSNMKSDRPDLIRSLEKKEFVNLSTVFDDKSNNKMSPRNTTKIKSAEVKKLEKRPESPVYENIDQIAQSTDEILQELTKAADQILQAVNGYTDEDSKLSSEERSRRNSQTILETISESKTLNTKTTKNEITPRNRLSKPTSSTSSLESITKEVNKQPTRTTRTEKLREDLRKKKTLTTNSTDSSSSNSKLKARRLQRASSREALLQSHGSSSEDLPNNLADIRKPRLVRRTKGSNHQTSITTTSTSEVGRKSSTGQNMQHYQRKKEEARKASERTPVIGLQEIRHKTAVSTIRSTAEKAASREKNLKLKEDKKKIISTKPSVTKSVLQKAIPDRVRSSRDGTSSNAIRTSSGVGLKKPS